MTQGREWRGPRPLKFFVCVSWNHSCGWWLCAALWRLCILIQFTSPHSDNEQYIRFIRTSFTHAHKTNNLVFQKEWTKKTKSRTPRLVVSSARCLLDVYTYLIIQLLYTRTQLSPGTIFTSKRNSNAPSATRDENICLIHSAHVSYHDLFLFGLATLGAP